MKINISYSPTKDLDNYIRALYSSTYLKHGRENFEEKLISKYPDWFKEKYKTVASESEMIALVNEFLERSAEIRNERLKAFIPQIRKIWDDRGNETISNLERVYANSFPFLEVSAYITTLPICPYNYKHKWFMIFLYANPDSVLRTISHELNHFMFYYYFPELRDTLGNEKYERLKEALAIFTNTEGNDKPAVKPLEDFFKNNLDKTIPEVLESTEWKKYL